MKRIFAILLLSSLLVDVRGCASDNDNAPSMRRRLVDGLGELGENIGRTEFPLIGQLKDLLPFAIAGYCYHKYPKQTMITLTGLLIYVLYNNDSVRSVLRKYINVDGKTEKATVVIKAQPKPLRLEDSFFDFDGDVELDEELLEEIDQEIAQLYQQETMDEFFEEVGLDQSADFEDEYTERKRTNATHSALKFL